MSNSETVYTLEHPRIIEKISTSACQAQNRGGGGGAVEIAGTRRGEDGRWVTFIIVKDRTADSPPARPPAAVQRTTRPHLC